MTVHGNLEPLVKIDLSPRTVFRVGVWWGGQENILSVSVRSVFSTAIGPAPTRLGSHWSSSNEAWLSLVESLMILLLAPSL